MIDFIHVLEYLWKAAWCFHAPRDPAMEDWVIAQALDILHGRTGEVITRIQALAAEHPPKPGGEHAKIIRKTLSYLQNKQAWMDYPRALAEGWPIATGVIEGACRHLVQDRMGITGARWWITPSLVETRFSPDALVWVTVVFHGTAAWRNHGLIIFRFCFIEHLSSCAVQLPGLVAGSARQAAFRGLGIASSGTLALRCGFPGRVEGDAQRHRLRRRRRP